MRLKIHRYLWAWLILASAVAQAQPERTFTMQQVIDRALAYSFDAYRFEYSYELSHLSWLDTRYSLRPSLRFSSTLSDYNRSIQELWDSEQQRFLPYEVQRLVNSASINLYQPLLLTGGTVSVSSGLRRNQNFGEDFNTLNYISTPVSVSYNQDFSKPNQFKWSRKIGELLYTEAQKQRIENAEQVTLQAISTFYQLLIAQNQLLIAQLNLSNADSLMWMARQKKDIFAISRADYLSLELQQSNAGIALEQARNELENQQFAFNVFLGLPPETLVNCITPEIGTPILIDRELALSKVFENNPDILSIQRRLTEAERTLAEAGRQAVSLNFGANLGLNQNRNQIADAYTDLLNQQGVSLTLSVPLYDGGSNRRRVERARLSLEYQQREAAQSQIELRQEIVRKLNNFQITSSQLEAYAKSDTLGMYVYAAVKERFILGKASLIDVINAEERRQSARLSYLRQLQEYWLQYYGIRLLCLYDFEQNQDLGIREN